MAVPGRFISLRAWHGLPFNSSHIKGTSFADRNWYGFTTRGRQMKITTKVLAIAAFAALAACNQQGNPEAENVLDAAENQADALQNEADALMNAAENQAEALENQAANVTEAAENTAENMTEAAGNQM